MTNKSKIFIFYHGRFPSEKAAALMAAKTAESFVRIGHEVELIVPRRKSVEDRDPFDEYSLLSKFKVVHLKALDLIEWKVSKKFGFKISHLSFAFALRRYLNEKANDADILYSNETISFLFTPKTRVMCYELHDYPEKSFWFYNLLFKKVTNILVTNEWKQKQLHKDFPVSDSKTFVEMNAVEVDDFDITLSQQDAKSELGLENEDKIILYTGHLFGWKGVDTLAESAAKLPDGHRVFFVGGVEEDVKKFKQKFGAHKNVVIVGHRPHEEMPVWQKAADVLVIPNTAKEKISKYYTSPMKLFEYLASKKPVVASDIPSIREVAKGASITYFEPDNSDDLAKKIIHVLNSKTDDLSTNMNIIKQHSWKERAGRIVSKF